MGYGSNAFHGGRRASSRQIYPGLGRSGHIFLRNLQARIDANTYPLAWERPGGQAGRWGVQQSPYLTITNRIDSSVVCRLQVADYGKDLQVGMDFADVFEQANEYLRLSVVGYIEMVECLVGEAIEKTYLDLHKEIQDPIMPDEQAK